jgi:uncharacterized protein
MQFEWDESKGQSNLQKHGISFEEAIEIFDGPVLTRIDLRDYTEVREISVGAIAGIVVLVVVHTDRNGITRIISARKGNRKERRLYHDYLARASR